MFQMPHVLQMALLAVFPALLLYAALNDFRHYRIPNKLNLAIFGSFFPVAVLLGMPWEVMLGHVISFATVFGFMFVLFMLLPGGKLGGGDVKMISAVAVWIDWQFLPNFVVTMLLAGGLLAVVMWLWQKVQIEYGVWMQGDKALRKVMSHHIKLPYGAAIAAGGLHAYMLSWWSTLLG